MAANDVRDEIHAEFGRRLREQRGVRPRWKIASESGISPETIGRYERGDGGPNIADAMRIARALGCKLSDLLPDAEAVA